MDGENYDKKNSQNLWRHIANNHFCISSGIPKVHWENIDFEKELELIHLKLNLAQLESIINDEPLNIQLTYSEELHIMLMSLPENCNNKKELLTEAVKLLKNEQIFHKEKIETIRSVLNFRQLIRS